MKLEVAIAILTPYLTQVLEETNIEKEDLDWQIKKAGYVPGEKIEHRCIETMKHIVVPFIPEYLGIGGRFPHQYFGEDLIIIGSTPAGEEETQSMRGTGAIVARYSIFHGGPSKYSGLMPHETGYSLDIPKDPTVVKKLIRNDGFLDAILFPTEQGIIDAVQKFNKDFRTRVLVTPYLATALGDRK